MIRISFIRRLSKSREERDQRGLCGFTKLVIGRQIECTIVIFDETRLLLLYKYSILRRMNLDQSQSCLGSVSV
jgi:hypothetical protein